MSGSPFPGMDPYLETHWRSVHHRLITYLGDQLQAVLPTSFRVDVEERLFVSGDVDASRVIAPDVVITQRPVERSEHSTGILAATQPIVIEWDDEPITEAYLEIVDMASGNSPPSMLVIAMGAMRISIILKRCVRLSWKRTQRGVKND